METPGERRPLNRRSRIRTMGCCSFQIGRSDKERRQRSNSLTSSRRQSACLLVAVLSTCASTLSAEPETQNVDASPSTTLSGVLEAIVVDDFAQDTSEMQYYLSGDDGTGRQIHFPAAPRLRPGARLTVTGQAIGDVFFAYTYEETLPSVSMRGESADGDTTHGARVPSRAVTLTACDSLPRSSFGRCFSPRQW